MTKKNERDFPKIVCLCGSTRFMEAYKAANLTETLKGNIVLTVGCESHSDVEMGLSADVKADLDQLHKRKIDLADEILVLNCRSYIGNSTRSEIEYAKQHGKVIRYLEECPKGGEHQYAPLHNEGATCINCGEDRQLFSSGAGLTPIPATIDKSYVLRLFWEHQVIFDVVDDLKLMASQGLLGALSSSDPQSIRLLNNLNTLIGRTNRLEDIFAEALTDQERDISTDEEFSKQLREYVGAEQNTAA